jgi:hypothetical protein
MKLTGTHVLAVLVAGLTVAACGGNGSPADQSPSGNLNGAGVLLTTDQSSYSQGSVVRLTIQNEESVRLAYNACIRELEVRDGPNWIPGPASLRLCTRDVRYVEARTTRPDSTDLDLGLTPGEYRIVLGFSRDYAPEGDVTRAVSNPFTITP